MVKVSLLKKLIVTIYDASDAIVEHRISRYQASWQENNGCCNLLSCATFRLCYKGRNATNVLKKIQKCCPDFEIRSPRKNSTVHQGGHALKCSQSLWTRSLAYSASVALYTRHLAPSSEVWWKKSLERPARIGCDLASIYHSSFSLFCRHAVLFLSPLVHDWSVISSPSVA